MSRIICTGPRDVSAEQISACTAMGMNLAREGHTVVTGGALGSEISFLAGAHAEGGSVEVVLPWSSYNYNLLDPFTGLVRRVYDKKVHLAWRKLASQTCGVFGSRGHDGRKYLCRNVGMFFSEDGQVAQKVCMLPGKDTGHVRSLADFLGVPIVELEVPREG